VHFKTQELINETDFTINGVLYSGLDSISLQASPTGTSLDVIHEDYWSHYFWVEEAGHDENVGQKDRSNSCMIDFGTEDSEYWIHSVHDTVDMVNIEQMLDRDQPEGLDRFDTDSLTVWVKTHFPNGTPTDEPDSLTLSYLHEVSLSDDADGIMYISNNSINVGFQYYGEQPTTPYISAYFLEGYSHPGTHNEYVNLETNVIDSANVAFDIDAYKEDIMTELRQTLHQRQDSPIGWEWFATDVEGNSIYSVQMYDLGIIAYNFKPGTDFYEPTTTNQPPYIYLPDFNLAEDADATILFDELNDWGSDPEGDILSYLIIWQSNPELVYLTIDGNQLSLDSLAADQYGESWVTLEVSDGELTDQAEFLVTVEPRADITFILKDVCADTVMSSDTSRFFFDGVEYTSLNGTLTLQLEPETAEFDATNPNSIDNIGSAHSYLGLRNLGEEHNFEERHQLDFSSPINPGTEDRTIICYKIPADFNLTDARQDMDPFGIGTIRYGDDALNAPAWYDLFYQAPDSTQRAWFQELFGTIIPGATGKLNMQYIESDTMPGEFQVDPMMLLHIDPSEPGPQHGEDWDENNEMVYSLAWWNNGITQRQMWDEVIQSIGIRYADPYTVQMIGGNPNNVELTDHGYKMLRVLYQFNPAFHL